MMMDSFCLVGRFGRKVEHNADGLPAGSGRPHVAASWLWLSRARPDLRRLRQEERCSTPAGSRWPALKHCRVHWPPGLGLYNQQHLSRKRRLTSPTLRDLSSIGPDLLLGDIIFVTDPLTLRFVRATQPLGAITRRLSAITRRL